MGSPFRRGFLSVCLRTFRRYVIVSLATSYRAVFFRYRTVFYYGVCLSRVSSTYRGYISTRFDYFFSVRRRFCYYLYVLYYGKVLSFLGIASYYYLVRDYSFCGLRRIYAFADFGIDYHRVYVYEFSY